jgi:hypothetical protein
MRTGNLLLAAAASTAIAAAPARAALTEDNFLLRNAGDLVALCSAAQSDPLYTAAINFCHGFGLGTFRVLRDEEVARQRPPHMFCLPEQLPTRNEAIAEFVQWVNADPVRPATGAEDSIAAYLAQKYPCPRGK